MTSDSALNSREEAFRLVRSSHRNLVIFAFIVSAIMFGAEPAPDIELLKNEVSYLDDIHGMDAEVAAENFVVAMDKDVKFDFGSAYQDSSEFIKKLNPDWQGSLKFEFDVPLIFPGLYQNRIWDAVDFWNRPLQTDFDSSFTELYAVINQAVKEPDKTRKLARMISTDTNIIISFEVENLEIKVDAQEDPRCRGKSSLKQWNEWLGWRLCLYRIYDLENLRYANPTAHDIYISIDGEKHRAYQLVDLNGWSSVKHDNKLTYLGANLLRSVGESTNLISEKNAYLASLFALRNYARADNSDHSISDVRRYIADPSADKTQGKIKLPYFPTPIEASFLIGFYPLGFSFLLLLCVMYLRISNRIIAEQKVCEANRFYPVIVFFDGESFFWSSILFTLVCLHLPYLVLWNFRGFGIDQLLGTTPLATLPLYLYLLSLIIFSQFYRRVSDIRRLLHPTQVPVIEQNKPGNEDHWTPAMKGHRNTMPVLSPVPIETDKHKPIKSLIVWLKSTRNWKFESDWDFYVPEINKTIVIPRGFIFDGASVPKRLRGYLSPVGLLLIPGIVQDFGYRYDYLWLRQVDGTVKKEFEGVGRVWWDQLFFKVGNFVNGVFIINWLAWIALALAGWIAWEKNRNNKANELLPGNIGLELPND